MDRYMGKFVEVEAVQLTKENASEVATWCSGFPVTEIDALDPNKTYVGINVSTPSGPVRVSEGEYVIQDLNGRFLKMSAQDFHDRYTPTDG